MASKKGGTRDKVGLLAPGKQDSDPQKMAAAHLSAWEDCPPRKGGQLNTVQWSH